MSVEEPPRWKFIDEQELKAWLAAEGSESFRYKVRPAGLWFGAMVGMLGAVILFLLWAKTGLQHANQIAGMFVPIGMIMWSLHIVFAWNLFAYRSWIIVTKQELILGKGRKAVVFQRSQLTREALRFDEVKTVALNSALPVVVEGQRFKIHITGAFAFLDKQKSFIAHLLEGIWEDEQEGEA